MPKSLNEAIHITLSFDENYINQFYVLATSIFANNSHNIVIHAITSGISEIERKAISDYIVSYNSIINFYSVPADFGKNFRLDGNWTVATYYRLLFPKILPIYINKFIYIDSDTLVVGDLSELWSTDLKSSVIAAVEDRLVTTRPDLGIYRPNSYFNAGILVINRHLWVEQNITAKAVAFLNDFPEKIFYADQDALNYLFKDNWVRLSNRFNLMYADIPEALPSSQFTAYLEDKVIIHFTQHRPWKMLCENRFRYLYHHHLRMSPLGKRASKYTDYTLSVNAITKLLRIRLRELYFDNPQVATIWRGLKSLLLAKASSGH